MKQMILVIAILILAIMQLSAQIDLSRAELNPYLRSMLNTGKFQMSHSMGFEAGSSSSGMGYYLSRYTNHINYKFNPKLELDLDLNFVNFGSAKTNTGIDFNDDNKSQIIPEFSLRYRPTDSVSIELRYEQNSWMNRRLYNHWLSNPAR